MSTLEQTIENDLAALAADNRRGIRALDATLHAVSSVRVDAPLDPAVRALALHAAGLVYVRRLASTVAGAVATVCTLAVLVWFSNPFGLTPGPRITTVVDRLVYSGLLPFGLSIAFVALVTYLAARWVANRQVTRLLAQPPSDVLASLRDRARFLGGIATALRIAGTASVVITLGLSWVTIGLDRYAVFWERDPSHVLELMHHVIIVAVVATIAVSAGIGLTRNTRLGHPAVTAAGVVLGAATVVVGLRFDVGPIFETFAAGFVPSTALRIGLTLTGSLAVVLVTASAALRRVRREDARLTER